MKFQPTSRPPSESAALSIPTVWDRLAKQSRRFSEGMLLVTVGCLLQACPGPKPVPPATPTPAATPMPTETPSATPTPVPVSVPRYSGVQQGEYIKTAQAGFIEARSVKVNAFNLAYNAFSAAGGANGTGLSSKAAVTARRGLIEQCRVANEDYLTFVSGQDEVYRQELAKTPLVQGDVDTLVTEYAEKGKKDSLLKVRENKRAILKAADDMMAFLEKKDGDWKLGGDKISFKKPADVNAFSTLGREYNKYVQTEQKLQADMNAPLPTPSDSLAPTTSPAPGASTAPTVASPAAVASPKP